VVNRLLLELEARALFDTCGREAAKDWDAGRFTAERVEAAILEHRRQHPYR
jgi:hypothetical protein